MDKSLAGIFTGEIERLATGFQFTEGPVWVPQAGSLLFSDIPANTVYRATPGGKVSVFRFPSGNSNGLTLDLAGRFLACEHGNRRVSLTEADGSVKSIASHYQGKKLNSPNDIVVKSDGVIYFTDPPYGISPEQAELGFQGVYRLKPGGEPELLVDSMEGPNGLAFSPDERVLYIGDSIEHHIRRFVVAEDGTLSGGEVFASVKADLPGAADGMKVDAEGRLFSTGQGGVWVFEPSGALIVRLDMPEVTANCAFGGTDGCDFYMTATTSVYVVRTTAPGATCARK